MGARRLHITLRQLEVFAAVARERSTRAAADSMARSQSAASSALAELEELIGHQLFDRVGRRLVLNESGMRLLPAVSSLLDQALELEGMLDEHLGSPLSIAASMTVGEYLLPDLLTQWQASHPGSSVCMQVMNTSAVLDAVANLECDLGFVEGFQARRNLKVYPWRTDEMVIVARVGHPLTRKKLRTQDLQGAHWALREQGSGSRDAAERWLLEHLGPITVAFELGTPQAVVNVVARCDALACLPAHAVARAISVGELVLLKSPLPPLRRQLSIITHADKRIHATCRSFISHCMPAFDRYAQAAS